MYFPYFHSFTPQKSLKVENYWMVIEFFGNYISKCPNLMKKRTPVPAYILLLSLSNKLKLLVNHYGTPCTFKTIQRMGGGQSFPPKIHFLMWFVNSAFRRAYIRIYKARLESNNRRGVYLISKSPSVCHSFLYNFPMC